MGRGRVGRVLVGGTGVGTGVGLGLVGKAFDGAEVVGDCLVGADEGAGVGPGVIGAGVGRGVMAAGVGGGILGTPVGEILGMHSCISSSKVPHRHVSTKQQELGNSIHSSLNQHRVVSSNSGYRAISQKGITSRAEQLFNSGVGYGGVGSVLVGGTGVGSGVAGDCLVGADEGAGVGSGVMGAGVGRGMVGTRVGRSVVGTRVGRRVGGGVGRGVIKGRGVGRREVGGAVSVAVITVGCFVGIGGRVSV